ncbi:hypothetical protein PVN24_10360 [Bacillus paralicheniformis]|uniref:hypothetical protein n=1 Tax=Bacillus paralicheniformis TaxID=1648923 RepID=UPI00080DCFF7|nr:hypothetical protein [Bacillus paralicheniformis]MDE1383266.1 hypothetical protein [Bacillus paralicheniformis]
MTETKKYVRILKAKYASSWYADKIGEVFEVEREANLYTVRRGDESLTAIRKEDAELIVTEKRPAKVGERVLITDKYGTSGEYKDGDILTADLCIGHAITAKEVDLTIIFHSEYEVIVNNEVKNGEADEVERYDTAVENAREAIEELRLAAYAKGYEDARRELTATAPVEKTAQERRDEIVEQAKADINELKNRNFYEVPDADNFYNPYICTAEFIVNNQKRTVVALLRGANTSKVYARGIAKATPDDCFNVHIGKAIALHRALGLEVPDEYLNAPQPTEVRVGDVVRYVPTTGHVKEFTVGKIADGKAYDSDHPGLFAYLDAQNRYSLPCINPKTIDDSRTEVGE